jgi:hypothetical protein
LGTMDAPVEGVVDAKRQKKKHKKKHKKKKHKKKKHKKEKEPVEEVVVEEAKHIVKKPLSEFNILSKTQRLQNVTSIPDFGASGLNFTFPSIQGARAKAEKEKDDTLALQKGHHLRAAKLARLQGGSRVTARVVLSSCDVQTPIEICCRLFGLNEEEKRLAAQYPYALTSMSNPAKNEVRMDAFDFGGFPRCVMEPANPYFMVNTKDYATASEIPLTIRVKSIINDGLKERDIFRQLPVPRLLRFAIDGGKSCVCVHGTNRHGESKCRALFGDIDGSSADPPAERYTGVLTHAMDLLFREKADLSNHTTFGFDLATIIIFPNNLMYDMFDPNAGQLSIYWNPRKKEFNVRPLRWRTVSSNAESLRYFSEVQAKYKSKYRNCTMMLYLRITNRPRKVGYGGPQIENKTVKRMEGTVAFILLPEADMAHTRCFEDIVLAVRRNVKEGYQPTQPDAFVVPYRNSRFGQLLMSYIEPNAACLIVLASKRSPRLAEETARMFVVASQNLKRSMALIRAKNGAPAKTPRMRDNREAEEERKRKVLRTTSKRSLNHKKGFGISSAVLSSAKKETKEERQERLRLLKVKEDALRLRRVRRLQFYKGVSRSFVEDAEEDYYSDDEEGPSAAAVDVPLVNGGQYVPLLDEKSRTKPVSFQEAIDEGVLQDLSPSPQEDLEKSPTKNAVLLPDDLEESGGDKFFDDLKDSQWKEFKKNLDLQNWLEDLIFSKEE